MMLLWAVLCISAAECCRRRAYLDWNHDMRWMGWNAVGAMFALISGVLAWMS